MIQAVTASYRQAWRFLSAFLATHVFFLLVSSALLVPIIGSLLSITLSFSDQTALTDQDIARFMATPAGAIGGAVTLSVVIAALILDVSVMTASLRSGRTRPTTALKDAITFSVKSAPRLVVFALHLLGRILLISAPFILAAAALFVTQLTEFDVNYYLTARPPEFLWTAAFILLLFCALVIALLYRLSGWAVALHFALFAGHRVSEAFSESSKCMRGHRRSLVAMALVWFAFRVIVAAAIAALTSAALGAAPEVFSSSLSRAATAVLAILVAAYAANVVLSAWSNGALADVLNDIFESVSEGRVQSHIAHSDVQGSRSRLVVIAVPILAIMTFSAASLGAGTYLLERISADADVAVIAHRGASASRPENTMAAVEKAIDDGADWVEIDVQEDANGVVIVAHDSDFMKAAGNPLKVWNATQADLALIDIGSWFDPAFRDQRTPSLRDVLRIAQGRSRVIIELKYYGHDVDLEKRVIDVVEDLGMEEDVATMSLKYGAVQKMRALRPNWQSGVLAATAIGDLTGLEGDFLALNVAQISSGLIQRAEASGKQVYAWTVNDPTKMSRLISMGVHGLITDDPELANRVIVERNALPTAARFALWISDTFGVEFASPPTDEASS